MISRHFVFFYINNTEVTVITEYINISAGSPLKVTFSLNEENMNSKHCSSYSVALYDAIFSL